MSFKKRWFFTSERSKLPVRSTERNPLAAVEELFFVGALVVVLAAQVEDRMGHGHEVVLADLEGRVAVLGGEHRHDRRPAEIVARIKDNKME